MLERTRQEKVYYGDKDGILTDEGDMIMKRHQAVEDREFPRRRQLDQREEETQFVGKNIIFWKVFDQKEKVTQSVGKNNIFGFDKGHFNVKKIGKRKYGIMKGVANDFGKKYDEDSFDVSRLKGKYEEVDEKKMTILEKSWWKISEYGKKDFIFENSGNIVGEKFQVKESQEVVPAIEQLIEKKEQVPFGSMSEPDSNMNKDDGIFGMTVDAVKELEESFFFPRQAMKGKEVQFLEKNVSLSSVRRNCM